jgi:hypothetical protein
MIPSPHVVPSLSNDSSKVPHGVCAAPHDHADFQQYPSHDGAPPWSARTAFGDRILPKCRTAKIYALSPPSIGDDSSWEKGFAAEVANYLAFVKPGAIHIRLRV